jgi:arsenate reductase
MAEGWLKALGGENWEAKSAGTAPVSVHPLAIRTMAEIGIDISQQRAKSVNEFLNEEFDLTRSFSGKQSRVI